jgi:hypothetical protein
MGVLNPLRIGPRPVRTRVLVLYRADPAALEPLLPKGMQPRLWRGCGIVGLCYTRLGALGGRFWPQRLGASSDHLAYRIAVDLEERSGVQAGTWVPLRETSSWLRARYGGKLQRGDYRRAEFQVELDPFGLRLLVTSGDHEDLYLRAEVAPDQHGSIFATPRSAEEFLVATRGVRPVDVIAPEADDIELALGSSAPEPLRVFELRSDYLADPTVFPPGALALDSAFRLVSKRFAPRPSPAVAMESVLAKSGAPPAVTAFSRGPG